VAHPGGVTGLDRMDPDRRGEDAFVRDQRRLALVGLDGEILEIAGSVGVAGIDSCVNDGTYAGCAEWGERRWATPGVVVDGKLVTTNMIAATLMAFIEDSW
jgi:hypothetical protein